MNNTDNIVENFELVLKKQGLKKPSVLYSCNLQANKQTHKPQDVIASVFSQLKAIQAADCTRICKHTSKELNNYEKSTFIPLNKLSVFKQVELSNANKFETQCVSDTQLINIIDDAEALMTTEFETSFHNLHTEKDKHSIRHVSDSNKKEKIVDNSVNIWKKMPSNNYMGNKEYKNTVPGKCDILNDKAEIIPNTDINDALDKDKNSLLENEEYPKMFNCNVIENNNTSGLDVLNIEITQATDDNNESDLAITNVNQWEKRNLENDCIQIEANDLENPERPPSPVLNIFKSVQIKSQSPLIFNLVDFEHFEKIAVPILKNASNIHIAKQLINFKILMKDSLRRHLEVHAVNENRKEVEDNRNELKTHKDFENDIIKCNILHGEEKKICNDNKKYKVSDILSDEILFSSDEEISNNCNKLDDLPFTCGVKTYFYDKSDVLDKTIYVGFQTASNKSIQVFADSFVKANSILGNVHDTCERDQSLTELVQESYDINFELEKNINNKCIIIKNQNTKNKHEAVDTEKLLNADLSQHTELNDTKINFENKSNSPWSSGKKLHEIVRTSKPTEIRNYCFMTGNGKKIAVSTKVMNTYKKVFQDIDLEEDFSIQSVQIKINCKVEEQKPILDCIDDIHTKAKCVDIITEAAINQTKDNYESIIQEFENSKNSFEVDKIKTKTRPLQFPGFKTASSKNINISDVALTSTKNVFQGIDLAEISEEYTKEKKSSVTQFVPIKTKDADVLERNVERSITNLKFNQAVDPNLNSFKTASNKKITISEQALLRTRNVFQDIDYIDLNISKSKDFYSTDTDITEKAEIQTNNTGNSPYQADFVGFKTANNKEINISSDALTKTNDIFREFDKEVSTPSKKTKPTFQGFKTASNRQVKISREALIRSKKKIEDIEVTDNETRQNFTNSPVCNQKLSTKALCGFKAENIEPVNLSAELSTKRQHIFEDVAGVIIDMNKVNPNILGNKNKMSYYATNKPVTIAAERATKSIKDSRNVNSMENQSKESKVMNLLSNEGFSNFQGFQTASNKKIDISKEALAHTMKLFEDIDEVEKESYSGFKGFQTASNKEVLISENALTKSRKILQDIDFNEDCNEIIKNICNKETAIRNKNTMNIVTSQSNTTVFQLNRDTKGCVKISKDSLHKSHNFSSGLNKQIYTKIETQPKCGHIDENINVDHLMNTQVINNFEETLCTEDFHQETPRNKRSSSPILSCPKAKKRKKFETPYRNDHKYMKDDIKTVDFILDDKNIVKIDDSYKKNTKFALKDLLKFEKLINISETFIEMSFDNLLKFDFTEERNDLTQGKVTMKQLKQFFLDSVNQKLIPDGWLDNHLKLIVWKLLSYEIKFPNTLGIVCTAKNVTDQLKHRYKRELYNAERPALRKIMEKDDISSKSLILCIVSIYEDGICVNSITNTTKNIELLLTDGWYCIKANIDKMLATLVCQKKLVVGSKIVTNSAELINCEQGVAPWEDISAVRLKLSGNSTRRARWDARLGYHGKGAILSQLSDVKVDGGKVSRLRVFVTRVYPTLYVEKFEDGSTVTRSERLEHLHQMKYEAERQTLLEKLYEEVEKEFSDQVSQDSEDIVLDSSNKRKSLESGSQIAKIMKKCKDPAEFRAGLSASQILLLQDHTRRHREKVLQDIQLRIQEKMKKNPLFMSRNVVPLMTVRIAGVRETKTGVEVTKGMMSIWKPNDAVSELITEDAWIEVMNVVPTAIRYSEIQISAGRQSVFRRSKFKENEKLIPYMKTLKRKCYLINDLAQNASMTTDYSEIDTVGFIFLIDPSHHEFESIKNNLFQNVYLTDIDKNIICVNFWGGVKKFGFGNIIDTGQVVACANLQRRAGNTRRNIPQYRVTEYSYFTKTPKNETTRNFLDELNRALTGLDKRKLSDDCIVIKNNISAFKYHNNFDNITPYRLNNSDYNLLKHKMFIDTPLGVKSNKCEDFNLTGLDFESTFKQTETQELSPRTLLRKKRVNERISKLQMYGEPPPLSTIHIINKSKNATNSYKSPLSSKSEICASSNKLLTESLKTTIECNKADNNIQSSPVMLMNRTYVKRSVQPVKLNFSANDTMGENVANNLVDHFAEDFDGSPPLSLD